MITFKTPDGKGHWLFAGSQKEDQQLDLCLPGMVGIER